MTGFPRLGFALLVALGHFGTTRPAGAADKADPGPAVFAAGKVWQVHITLAADEYAAMQPRGGFRGFGAPAKAPDTPADPKREVHKNTFGVDLPWATGAVTVGDQTFVKVGVRYKGNGTIGDATRTIKKSFKIDLDRAGGSGRFGGSRAINLHCGVADPSKLRETLGYGLYREAGVPAPRTALAEVRLTVPGKYDHELLGVYTILEEVDKPFLRDRFGADQGLLLKPEGVREFEDKGDQWDAYTKTYKPKRDAKPEEAARLIAFARLVQKADDATFRKEIESYLDVDGYLRYLAATSFIANPDSFFSLGHNYCLYLHPKTKRLHFIPWDLDRSFSNLPVLGSNNQQMNLSLVHPYPGTHRLTERVLAVPGMGDRYQKLLKDLSATAFDRARLLKRLEAAEAAVKELIDRDAKAMAARKEVAGSAFGAMLGKPPEMRKFVERRTASVTAQVAGTSKGHVPVGGFGPGAPPAIGPIMAGMMIENLDTDRDEKLSREEWLAIARKLFAASEKDPDGTVSQKGLTAGLNNLLPEPPQGGFQVGGFLAGPAFKRADTNKDSKLTAEEAIAAAGAIFDEFDKGKSGKLDEDAFGSLLTVLFPLPNFGGPPKK